MSVGLAASASLGVVAAVSIPTARADLLPPLPTIPSLPATLPVALPTVPTVPTVPPLPGGSTSTVTVTTPAATTTTTPATTTTTSSPGGGQAAGGASGGSTPGSGAQDAAVPDVAGAVVPPSGAISIPVSSVTAPARLLIDRITISPKWIRARGQLVHLLARIADSRGYRVRGAAVAVRGAPARMVKPLGARESGSDGVVRLQFRTRSLLPLRAGSKLTLVVRASRPGAAPTAGSSARRVVTLRVRPR